MNESFNESTAIYGHTDPDTALVVEDYPYGFTLRTQIRYWIESNKRGDRFVSQTLNPKTGQWNKPKASTYNEVKVMYREPDTGYIRADALSLYDDAETIERFRTITAGHLSKSQQAHLAYVMASNKVASKVTWKIIDNATDEDYKRADENMATVAKAVSHEAVKTYRDLQTGGE